MDILFDGPVLRLSGDVDVRHTAELRQAVHDHLATCGTAAAVIDVSGVESVDLIALRVLANAARFGHLQGRRLVLHHCSAAVLRMLHISRLIRFVEVERERIPA